MLSPNQTMYTSQIRLNVESMFEIEIMLKAKIEQLMKQKLLRKLHLEDEGKGGANEHASLKNDINLIVASLIYAK